MALVLAPAHAHASVQFEHDQIYNVASLQYAGRHRAQQSESTTRDRSPSRR